MIPPEPPVGAVLAYRRYLDGRAYDYVSLRAGDGLWYTTGGTTAQGVTWPALWAAVELCGSAFVATAWAVLEAP